MKKFNFILIVILIAVIVVPISNIFIIPIYNTNHFTSIGFTNVGKVFKPDEFIEDMVLNEINQIDLTQILEDYDTNNVTIKKGSNIQVVLKSSGEKIQGKFVYYLTNGTLYLALKISNDSYWMFKIKEDMVTITTI